MLAEDFSLVTMKETVTDYIMKHFALLMQERTILSFIVKDIL